MSAIKKNTIRVPLILRVVPLYILTAVLLVIIHTVSMVKPAQVDVTRNVHLTTTSSQQQSTPMHIISGQPTRITVERLGIDLSIDNGYYDKQTKEWTLSNNAAYYATMTTAPNNSHGSTFIYGHNTSQVFWPLKDIQSGDIVKIYTSNGHVFQYVYRNDAVVTPDITNVLYENPSTPQLTIMTCEGIWSKVRRIMYFDYVGVQ